MENLFVIDASNYLYSSYFAIRNMTNEKGESTNALFGFIRSLIKLRKDFNPSHLIVVFDGPNNAKKRKELYPDYKAHRAVTPPDLRYQIDRAQTFCQLMGVPMLSIPNYEADDTMGTIAVWAASKGTHVYLCSGDKDLGQLVNEKISILNTSKDNLILGPSEIAQTYGVPPNLMVDYLAIVGDASDNVPGLPGFGPKTAIKLLQQFGSLDALLENASLITEAKKRETLLEKRDLALLSRQLVTLDLSVDIPQENFFFSLQNPDVSPLKQFYQEMNFKSLLKDLELDVRKDVSHRESVEYITVDDEELFQELLKTLFEQKVICFDVETTDINPLKAELVGIGFGFEPAKSWYVPVNGQLGLEIVLKGVKPLFENPEIGFYGHNIKYDLHVLANHDIEVAHVAFDTLLASYLLHSHSRQHSLETLALEHFGQVTIPITDLIGKGKHALTMKEVAIEKVSEYCCEDVDYTVRLKKVFDAQIKERHLESLFYNLELPLIKVLTGMERYGLFLDVPSLSHLSVLVNAQIDLVKEKIYKEAGEEFNINSPKQLIVIFEKLGIRSFKKTPTGNMRTDSDVLESMKDKHPFAGLILEYRGLEKLRSTYLDALPQEVHPLTDRIHCTFNQFVAATGRLSCQDPNLQNIPVRSELGREIRTAFCPQNEGWSYLAADYSQIELRLLAHFSEDPILLQAFQNNEDVHAHTASIIFDVPLKDVTKELRYNAKAVNFGIIYGQQAFGLAQELAIDVKVASQFIEMYFKRYSRVREFIEACKERARLTGKATTLTGRERMIPEILSKNLHMRAAAERLAVNTPLQGTAADLIKMAMLKLAAEFPAPLKKLQRPKSKGMILQIHDELIFECKDNELEEMEKVVRRAMQDVVQLKVPLIVDLIIGKNWKEC